MKSAPRSAERSAWWMLAAIVLCTVVYWPGLSGAFLFDDYPNIVDNHGLQISNVHISSLVRAALSSPSSEFKRPLASLSFAANYLAAGLAPFSWKATNLVIHLLNGWLVFLLTKALLLSVGGHPASDRASSDQDPPSRNSRGAGIVAALIATGWMLLPINLTGVLYIVQRMESLANLFVLIGLLGYVIGRQRMMAGRRGLWLCMSSVLVATAIGLLAKETAVMLPLYAFLIEWIVFRFASSNAVCESTTKHRGLVLFFALALALPLLAGLAWLLPGLLRPSTWATRDFTMGTRLLSEARIVSDYVFWTLLPTPDALSFYHDDFVVSASLLSPWTTLAGILFIVALAISIWSLRHRRPLVALGLALYLGCHLLTGTILRLELIYEHRNYFASYGLLLALVPWLAAPRGIGGRWENQRSRGSFNAPAAMPLPRYVLLGGLLLLWGTETALTARAWSTPLGLAQELAARAPLSPRAQYELGRTYIIYSGYDPLSPFIEPAREALERAATLPRSSILPEQALIFMNARMHQPIKDAWWDSLTAKLRSHKPGVQDESSLGSLTQCSIEHRCELPPQRMVAAFLAALAHPHPSARLLATYSDYAWNALEDHGLALRLAREAIAVKPGETAYRVTEIRMLVALGKKAEAKQQYVKLEDMNIGGELNSSLDALRPLLE